MLKFMATAVSRIMNRFTKPVGFGRCTGLPAAGTCVKSVVDNKSSFFDTAAPRTVLEHINGFCESSRLGSGDVSCIKSRSRNLQQIWNKVCSLMCRSDRALRIELAEVTLIYT